MHQSAVPQPPGGLHNLTGFFELVPSDKIVETSLSIEEAFKMIISGGMVSPDALFARKPNSVNNKSGQKVRKAGVWGISSFILKQMVPDKKKRNK